MFHNFHIPQGVQIVSASTVLSYSIERQVDQQLSSLSIFSQRKLQYQFLEIVLMVGLRKILQLIHHLHQHHVLSPQGMMAEMVLQCNLPLLVTVQPIKAESSLFCMFFLYHSHPLALFPSTFTFYLFIIVLTFNWLTAYKT